MADLAVPALRAEQVRADPQVQTCSQNLRVSGVSGNCLWRVPCFHENALLRGDGPDDGLADNAASLAGGEDRDATTLEAAFPPWFLARACVNAGERLLAESGLHRNRDAQVGRGN